MRGASIVFIGCFSLILLGCSSYEGFKLEQTTVPPGNPGEVVITSATIQVPQGVAVGVRATAKGGDDPESGELFIVLQSKNPQVLQIWPTTSENTFVVCGGAEGIAEVTVRIDGQDDDSIAALVGPPLGVGSP